MSSRWVAYTRDYTLYLCLYCNCTCSRNSTLVLGVFHSLHKRLMHLDTASIGYFMMLQTVQFSLHVQVDPDEESNCNELSVMHPSSCFLSWQILIGWSIWTKIRRWGRPQCGHTRYTFPKKRPNRRCYRLAWPHPQIKGACLTRHTRAGWKIDSLRGQKCAKNKAAEKKGGGD